MDFSPSTSSDPGRRVFLRACGSTVAGSLLAAELDAEPAGAVCEGPPDRDKTIGIQVGAVSFVDEGVEQLLDIFQERGQVNTIYLTTFTYGRGLAGRQVRGQPFPDHGVQSSDEALFHGGNYARPHPQYYRDNIGIPTGRESRKASPEDTYAAVAAALKAGSDGVVLSRKYSEMRLDNLAAAGRAVRDCLQ